MSAPAGRRQHPLQQYSQQNSQQLPPQQHPPQQYPPQQHPPHASPQPQVVYDQNAQYSQPPQGDGLSFYPTTYAPNFAAPPAGGLRPQTTSSSNSSYGIMTASQPVSWLAALGTGGLSGEPTLLEELEINPSHIQYKTIAVLNPVRTIDKHIMDDTDLVGPLLFCLLFGVSLLLAGKVHFGYIYGVALMGWISIYGILNLMSESGIDTLRTASVLGYCLLPMVLLSFTSIIIPLQGIMGLLLGGVTVLWCTSSSANMFATALSMKEQRFLVAYPVGLFYFCFALMTVF